MNEIYQRQFLERVVAAIIDGQMTRAELQYLCRRAIREVDAYATFVNPDWRETHAPERAAKREAEMRRLAMQYLIRQVGE